MKKAVILLALFASSCVKNYTCECVKTYKPTGETQTETHTIEGTKGQKPYVVEMCEGLSYDNAITQEVCKLK